MNKTIVLAVDAAHHGPAAADMVRELSRDSGDRVIVLHVHEFAVGRFGRLQVDCPEGDGERLVAEIVDDLKQAGVTAEAEIREANYGHVARHILDVADQHDARMLVLGSHGHADLPLAFGSVAHRLLHHAHRPVLIVPGRRPGPTAAGGLSAGNRAVGGVYRPAE
jgi:nucleotide-binding universal stress UspA family protein